MNIFSEDNYYYLLVIDKIAYEFKTVKRCGYKINVWFFLRVKYKFKILL